MAAHPDVLVAPNPDAVSPGTNVGAAPAIATLTPTLAWVAQAEDDVTGYQVRVLDRTTGTLAVGEMVDATASQYTVAAGALLQGHLYTWSVWDVVGTKVSTTVAPSETLNFRTPVLPAPAALPLTGTGSATRPLLSTYQPAIRWTAVGNATGYVVHVTDDETGAVITHTVSARSSSFTFAAGELTPGHGYDWNVRDEIGTVTSVRVSNTRHFRLPSLPAVATLTLGTTAPTGAALTTDTPTFTWAPTTKVGGFSGYLLTLYDRTAGTSTTVTLTPAASSYTLPAGQLVANHRYEWNIRLVVGNVTGPLVARTNRYFVAPPKSITNPKVTG
jgi:hypothetical protein